EPLGGVAVWDQRTAVPYRPIWSIVWGAPTSHDSGGRSAVHTTSGTNAAEASATAAWYSAAAVPLVQTSTVGRPEARATPTAVNEAERSPRTTRVCSRSATARAIGVDRDPGETTASVTPDRTHSSTNVRQNATFTAPAPRAAPVVSLRIRRVPAPVPN